MKNSRLKNISHILSTKNKDYVAGVKIEICNVINGQAASSKIRQLVNFLMVRSEWEYLQVVENKRSGKRQRRYMDREYFRYIKEILKNKT